MFNYKDKPHPLFLFRKTGNYYGKKCKFFSIKTFNFVTVKNGSFVF